MALMKLVLLWFGFVVCLGQTSRDIHKGTDGGYSNIIVAIHRTVPENPQLIDKIKEIFTQASPALYKATFGGAYFRLVTIVVPSTWQHSTEYENASEDLYESAHFKVEGETNTYQDEPYTVQPDGCGKPGKHVLWTANYLLKDYQSKMPFRIDEKKEMRLLQEWARLRYGLFEEFGYPDNDRYPAYYRDEAGELKATMCTDSFVGNKDNDCPIQIFEDLLEGPIAKCWFVPFNDQDEPHSSSIMFTASVNGVDHFCDDTPERKHNSQAPNKHNALCNGKSAWSIISEHEDFRSAQAKRLMQRNARQPRNTEETRFQVLRTPGASDGRIVFVLDISGSMKGRPMEMLHAAASRALTDHVPDGSKVGIVSFSTRPRILADLTVVTPQSREELARKLPRMDDQGYTAIGKGLLEGLDVLKTGGEKTAGTHLILVTDGEENVGPKISEVIPEIKTSGTRVMAVAFGVKATDKLERLALATNGKVFFFPDLSGKRPSSELDSAFLESTTVLVSEEQQPIRIVEERMRLDNQWKERLLIVENSLGKNLVITVTASKIDGIELLLTDPQGRGIGPGNANYHKDSTVLQRIRLEVPTAVQGTWKLSLISKSGPTTVDLSVLSHQRDYEPTQRPSKPIRIRAWLDDIQPRYPEAVRILAQVVRGSQDPVRGATVTAVITRPGNKSVDVKLKDNGAGADVTAADGIYSGYFTQYTANGRYAVFVRMITYDEGDNGGSREKRSPITKSTLVERVADAGSFRLENWNRRDEIPPSRVTDLLANSQVGVLDRLSLTWTSPGDDMDHGRAHEMDIRVSFDPDFLRGNFTACQVANNWLAHNLTLAHGGEAQRIELAVPEGHAKLEPRPSTYFFALRAKDEAGNIGEISNVASVTLVPEQANSQALQEEDRKLLVPLVAGACSLLILIALAGLALMFYTRRKDNKTKTHYFTTADDLPEKEML